MPSPRHAWIILGLVVVAPPGCAAPRKAEAQSTVAAAATGGTPASPPASTGAPATQSAVSVPRELRPDDFKGLAWRAIGPANMGGRVADIAIAPGNAKTYFVGYGTGGLFKTTNRGTTFTPVFDKEATASIGAVAVCDAPEDWPGWTAEEQQAASSPSSAPSTQKSRAERGKAKIVWVGTGEGNGRNSSSWGTGVYRSTDGGATFKCVGLADSHDIPRLAVDPRDPDVCYVAALGHLWGPNAERGLYKTTDGGTSWTPVLQLGADTGCCDVMIDPKNPDTVYAALYMRRRAAHSFRSGGPNGGIYKSTDGGRNWRKLAIGLPPQTGRIGMDLYAKDPRILMAVIESDVGGWPVDAWNDFSRAGGVFRTSDAGESWTRVHELAPRAFYFSKIRIDPTDDQRVYLLGYGLGVSDDGGKSFRAGGARKPHGDLHAMVIDPADRDHLLLGTDGGMYVSYDRAVTWDFLNNVPAGEFYNIAVDLGDPYRVGGGLQDNGTWIGPSATQWEVTDEALGEKGGGITNADWRFILNGDGFHVAFDPLDPNIVYAESQGGELVRIHLDTAIRKRIRPAPKEGHPRFRFNWNSPFFISPHQPTTLYFAGNYVFKLTDRGERWERISDDLSTRAIEKIESVGSEAETHCTVVSLAESPLQAGLLWAGTDDGRVHVTANDGKEWRDVTPPQTQGRYISRIEPSHHAREVCYVALDGHRMDDMRPYLVVTHDRGRNWTSIESDLPADGHVKVVREDPANPRVLYVGTERACFISIDAGRRWVRLNGDSLPTVAVDDLVIHPRARDLVAGTHGRSIYILDDAAPLAQLTPEVVNAELHVFRVAPVTPRRVLPYGGLWSDRNYRAANPPAGARITYWLREYFNEEVTLVITDGKDNPVRKLTGPARPGLNRVVWDCLPEEHDRFVTVDDGLGQKRFVAPGEYRLTVTCGTRSATGTITVNAADVRP